MRFVLVLTDTKRKNLFFCSDTLKLLSLSDALDAVGKRQVDNAYVVQKKSGAYIRTIPDTLDANNLESISLSVPLLYSIAHGVAHTTSAIDRYLELYSKTITDAGPFIQPHGAMFEVPTGTVIEMLQEHRTHIFAAAGHFSIDPHTIGAILIDEFSRLLPFEHLIDSVGVHVLSRNMSVGIGQVKLTTANDLIRKGLYNPNPEDPLLPFTSLNAEARKNLYVYVKDPKHNVFFVAALIRSFIDDWAPYADISHRPEILGTLYHLPYKAPHATPEANTRGKQIGEEFYRYAKQWMGKN